MYEDFIREHAYDLSNQNFLQWFGDFGIVVRRQVSWWQHGDPERQIIYAVIRAHADGRGGLWGTVVTQGSPRASALLIAPVFIAPLLNHYQPARPQGLLKSEILSVARAQGIPATNVYEFDASRQTKRVSANVSGMFGTTRISMNDNLLKRCTPNEIIAVLGHEMGHYVLNHVAIGCC